MQFSRISQYRRAIASRNDVASAYNSVSYGAPSRLILSPGALKQEEHLGLYTGQVISVSEKPCTSPVIFAANMPRKLYLKFTNHFFLPDCLH